MLSPRAIMSSGRSARGTPTPSVFRRRFFDSVPSAWPSAVVLVRGRLAGGPARPSARDGSFTAWALDPVLTVVTVWVAGLYLVGVWRCTSAATAGRWARTLAFVGGRDRGASASRPRPGWRPTTHPAQRAHGPAHGAVDGGAAVPGARRAGDAGAAHAAAAGRGAGCWRCCTRGWPVLTFPPLTFRCTCHARGRSTSPAGTTRRCTRVRARADAPAPRGRRLRCSSGRWSGIDPVPGRVGLPVPGAAGRADAAVPRVPGRHDHGPGRP